MGCRKSLVLAVAISLPLLVGGCPNFRNNVVDAVESAAVTVLASAGTTQDAVDSAGRGLLTSALSLLFGQFRVETTP